jgi:hypothetical protein
MIIQHNTPKTKGTIMFRMRTKIGVRQFMRSRSTFLHRHPLGRWAAQPRSRGCGCKCKCTWQRNPLRVSKSWIDESAVSVCSKCMQTREQTTGGQDCSSCAYIAHAQPGVGFVLQGWTQVTNVETNGGPFEDPVAQYELLLY